MTDTTGVEKILADWEGQARERDPRDPMRGQILAEAMAIRTALADMTRQRDKLTVHLGIMTRWRNELAAEVMRLLHARTLEAIQSGIEHWQKEPAEGAKP